MNARRADAAAKRLEPKRRRLVWAIAAAALLAAGLSCYRFWMPEVRAEVLLARAREALASEDYAAAEDDCLQLIARDGPSVAVLLVAGEAATKQGRLTEALGYYAQMPADGGQEAAVGFAAAGDILLQMHRASAAETQFRRALAVDLELLFAHNRLSYLLGIEGRRFESLPHLFALLRAGQCSIETLMLLGNHAATVEASGELEQFRQTDPEDVMPLIGEARVAIGQTRIAQAKQLLKQVLQKDPGQIEAQAELGQLLLSAADPELSQWLVAGASRAEEHPDVWLTRGLWAKQRGDPRGAARCFWEAIERDPVHQAATYQLAQTLESLGESQTAERLGARAAQLQKLSGVTDLLFHDRDNVDLLRSAAELTESLGCIWEAWAWHRVLLGVVPQAANQESVQRLQAMLREGAPLVLDAANPARQIDLSDFALPDWDAELQAAQPSAPELPKYRATFVDLAQQAGIDFRYFAGQESYEDGRRMFQFTGGGVAVLDYDADGWPDIYLTQGCRWPAAPGQSEHLDRLFRNLGDGTFEDVTARSNLAEDRFSQGVAAGDFNNDGFADLYVANVGANRLYINRGDGTFRDASVEAGLDGEAWTTSCLLADLNGDGLADIYDVNYVQGDDVYEKRCLQNGLPRACSPTVFASQPDRFYLNLGDGRFADRTRAAGLNVAGGNGLGVVAADFDGSGRLSLFVANDQDANFYFLNQAPQAGAAPQFVEQALLAGLAYDAGGKAQASMGVAAGDANGDGRLDLFVTNFYQESNTLYLQDDSGLFSDATAASGLRAASYEMLGFGAQFIDGELDGYPDLVMTNGHIDDFTHQQIPFDMPPQYFRGLGGGKFDQRLAAELGAFFERKSLGRGLARLDWNRDGREDFVVSHLDGPAALLANDSTAAGHYLAVQLRGVKSARDAIGAIVTLEAGGRSRRQWLAAGDGYQASNERKLVFGLAGLARVEKLQIHWPSGLTQEFADLAADQELIFVEGAPRFTRLPRVR